jgi:hypothetical protein
VSFEAFVRLTRPTMNLDLRRWTARLRSIEIGGSFGRLKAYADRRYDDW